MHAAMIKYPCSFTLVDVLQQHAAERPNDNAFTFLENGEDISAWRSFADLHRRSRAIAAGLMDSGMTGRTVLLLARDNLDFIDAFLGCLSAGAIPVPAAVPRPHRPISTLMTIASDAQVAGVLAGGDEAAHLQSALAVRHPRLRWLYIDDLVRARPAAHLPCVGPADIAFLQYTSGSTSSPKGVVVTHANLMQNEATIQHAMRLSPGCRFVGWLPLYHDMGLIGNVLQPLYSGIASVLMPPGSFLQKPVRWLAAISKYGATISGGPNFAYEHCVDKITPAQCAGLDLSAWTVAFNGSEPVRAETLERFSAKFASTGFRSDAFCPVYGMAESTLFTTGTGQECAPTVLSVARDQLAQGRAREERNSDAALRLVSCGPAGLGTRVIITDPATQRTLPDGTVGEVWISGPSVATGYWRNPEKTEEAFCASPSDVADGPFLRTGDLGFMHRDELFVTGRLKDVIIIRGRNHYPQDLENCAQGCHPYLAKGRGAAVADESQATVAIINELTREGWRNADPTSLSADIREAIAAEYGLRVERVLLIRPGTLPRTSSGKVRRAACRHLMNTGALETLPLHSVVTESALS
jgi:acyl-CoA synthetase (AMP-forming)/AMP-acid ligase II